MYSSSSKFRSRLKETHSADKTTMLPEDIGESPLQKEVVFAKAIFEILESKEPNIAAKACIAHGKKHAWIKICTIQKKVAFFLFQESGAICVDLYIGGMGSIEENQSFFDSLYAEKAGIERLFDKPIYWVRNHPRSSKACRIIVRNIDFLDSDFSTSNQAILWGADNLIKLYRALSPKVNEIIEKDP